MLLRIAVAIGAALSVATAAAQAQSSPPEDRWTFSVAPYLWLPNVNGTLNYSVPSGASANPSVEVGANDYLSDLKAALLLAGKAQKGRWSILTDVMYMRFGSQDSTVKEVNFVSGGPSLVSTSLNAGTSSELKALVWTLAGGYSLLDKHPGALDLIGGFRYLGLDASTDWNLTATITPPGGSATFPRSGSVSDSLDLWDGIIGVNGRIGLGESGWYVPYYADIGAGSESSTTYQWLLGLGYNFRWVGLVLVYRELYYDQGGDRLVQNLRFSGPALGVTFRF